MYKTNSIDKRLLTVTEFCEYLSIGKTKGRELLNTRGIGFRVKIGNRVFANKKLLDRWIDEQSR